MQNFPTGQFCIPRCTPKVASTGKSWERPTGISLGFLTRLRSRAWWAETTEQRRWPGAPCRGRGRTGAGGLGGEAAVEAPTTHPRAPPPRSREARPGWPCTPTRGPGAPALLTPSYPKARGKSTRGGSLRLQKGGAGQPRETPQLASSPGHRGWFTCPPPHPPEDTRSQGRDGHGATAGVLEDPASSGDRSGRVGGSTVGSRGGDDRDCRAARAA